MRKISLILSIMLALSMLFFIGCGQDEAASPAETENSESSEEKAMSSGDGYEDGFYFAQEDGFSEKTGWKYMALLRVEDGEIVEATWEGAHRNAGTSKKTQSKAGEYGMVEHGDAQAYWFEQAEKVEEKLLETQDPAAIEYDEDGYTDAISGVSIHINEFVGLAEEALAEGPVGRGMYEDGAYHAELDEFSHGWKDYVDLTVIGGYIVAAHWNAYPEEGEMHKYEYSKEGKYGMVENGGAQAQWWEQVDKAEAYLLEIQDPSKIEYTSEEGHVDSISGVSIHVKELFSLAEEALKEAK